MNQQYRRHRYPTEIPVIIATPLGRQNVTLIDVNQGGVRLKGINTVRRGDRITLHVMNEHVSGVVQWVSLERCGVSFLMPAPPRLVDILRQGVRKTAAARFPSVQLREMR